MTPTTSISDPTAISRIGSFEDRSLGYLHEIWRYREIAYVLARREIQIRYKQAAIGVAWVLIQPIVAMVIFTLLFNRIALFPSSGVPYPLFVFTGVIIWGYVNKTLTDGTGCIVNNRGIVTKIYFPKVLMPLSHLFEALWDLAIGLVMLMILMATYGSAPSWHMVFLPAFLALMMVFLFGLAAWSGALNVMFRDVKFIVQFAIQVGFFATPVIFPIALVPERWRWLMDLNPLAAVIEGARWSILGTDTLPGALTLAVGWTIALVVAISGYRYFKRAERGFSDLI